MAKLASSYAEKAKIAARNVRRDGMEALKTAEKKGKISQDEQKKFETELQKVTDKAMLDIDAATSAKEKEILGK
jgi:ribosome recycling factor